MILITIIYINIYNRNCYDNRVNIYINIYINSINLKQKVKYGINNIVLLVIDKIIYILGFIIFYSIGILLISKSIYIGTIYN